MIPAPAATGLHPRERLCARTLHFAASALRAVRDNGHEKLLLFVPPSLGWFIAQMTTFSFPG